MAYLKSHIFVLVAIRRSDASIPTHLVLAGVRLHVHKSTAQNCFAAWYVLLVNIVRILIEKCILTAP